ncbi:MAG: LptA/OstA family protein [Pseudomonadota bacterium]
MASLPPAYAQEVGAQLLGENPTVSEANPMLLQSDELIYDNRNDAVVASGNVEIYYNDYVLLADKVIYKQGEQTLEAVGNVRIKEPSGSIVNAERIRLTDDFRQGFIETLRVVTANDARIAAAAGRRLDGGRTEFDRGVFTACEACKDNPEKAPLWQFKAARIVQDEPGGYIYYDDVQLEFFGLPVFYLPFFAHADPSEKRKTGFLIPQYTQSEDLGTVVGTPFFWNIAPNMDATITPTYMSEQGILGQLHFRHRLESGSYDIKLAGIYQDDGPVSASGEFEFDNENEFRGSVITTGNFKLGDLWTLGWNVTAETDDTFRRFFKLDGSLVSDRVSQIGITGLGPRSYFSANAVQLGGLLAVDDENSEARHWLRSNYAARGP